jgi:carbon monoxide dehydrogenase subunit G
MKRRAFCFGVVAASVLATAAPVLAAKKLSVTESKQIHAPPDKVWEVVKNFNDLSWIPPVKGTTATKGNSVGSVRTVDVGDGKNVKEILVAYNAAKHTYTYRFTDDPMNSEAVPFSHYQSTITVKPAGGNASNVEWHATFERADLSANPPPEKNDQAAVKAVTGIYTSTLDALKKRLEGGG